MFTPVQYNPTFYIGSPITEEFRFVDDDDVAVDMTDYAPFKWQIRRSSSGPLLLELTLDEADIETGVLRGSATIAETFTLPRRKLYHDLLDNAGQKWFIGVAVIQTNITQI